jgi:hypothetical protein
MGAAFLFAASFGLELDLNRPDVGYCRSHYGTHHAGGFLLSRTNS